MQQTFLYCKFKKNGGINNMQFKIIQHDLLKMPKEYVMAHNIDSGETAMGAGVALAFCKEFPSLRGHCKLYASEHNHQVGLTCRYVSLDDRVVYNMFTKPHVWKSAARGMTKEEYHTNQRNCLEHLKSQMIENGETKLAMPKIACGLDRCEWEDIEAIIKDVFKDTDFEIVICVL